MLRFLGHLILYPAVPAYAPVPIYGAAGVRGQARRRQSLVAGAHGFMNCIFQLSRPGVLQGSGLDHPFSRTHDSAVAPTSNERGGASAFAQDHPKRNAEMRAESPLARRPVWAASVRVRRWRIEAGPRPHSGTKTFRNWQF